MEHTKNNNPNSTKDEKNLFAMLDKGGIDSEVHILRVLREERNWRSVLEREKMYTYP